MHFDRRGEPDQRSPARCGADRKRAADIFHSFAHVAQSISSRLVLHAIETAAIVLDLQREMAWLHVHPDPSRGRFRVTDNIRDRFFRGEKYVVADVWRDG